MRRTVTLVSGFLALMGLAAGCGGVGAESGSTESAVEVCEAGVRNEEWNIDCSAACNHVAACKATYGDSDIEALTCGDCLGSCIAGVELGGNDLVESTDEDRRAWQCAELVEGCSALDHNCDLF